MGVSVPPNPQYIGQKRKRSEFEQIDFDAIDYNEFDDSSVAVADWGPLQQLDMPQQPMLQQQLMPQQ